MSNGQMQTSGLAIASLICGCLFLIPFVGPLCSIAAIITGIAALAAINKNKDTLKGKGMAIAGVVLGAIGIILTIVAIVGIVMFSAAAPRFMELREDAQEASCQGSAASIRTALSAYYAKSAIEGEASFPITLYDPKLRKAMGDGQLPENPFGRDWNDYYDSRAGELDVEGACQPRITATQ